MVTSISLGGLLLGFLNCVIVAVILVLIGALCAWVLSALGWPIPWNIQRIYLALVALITLVCFVSLLLGAPMFRIVGGHVVYAADRGCHVCLSALLPWHSQETIQ
jgi:hypothetical protein